MPLQNARTDTSLPNNRFSTITPASPNLNNSANFIAVSFLFFGKYTPFPAASPEYFKTGCSSNIVVSYSRYAEFPRYADFNVEN